MAINPPVRRYSRDLGTAIPIVRFGPSEFPRLNTIPAPYLPLQLENDRHGVYYVILTGKVVALDSMGFMVPAGLKLDQEIVDAYSAANGNAVDFRSAGALTLTRYTQTDVDQGVVNSLGVTCTLNEPVVYSMLRTGAGAGLQAYDDTDNSVDVSLHTFANGVTIGEHLGIAPYSLFQAGTDVMTRAANANPLHPAAKVGIEALTPYDPTQLRELAFEIQNRTTVLVSEECLVYPVVANLSGLLIKGQAVAIGAAMADFALGGRVTYNQDSNIVPATASAVAIANLKGSMAGNDAADATAVLTMALKVRDRIVGQVVRKNTRFPSSYLNKVKTRWEDHIPGFNAIDRMPGSATDGKPWNMHTAGATLGEVQISLLVK